LSTFKIKRWHVDDVLNQILVSWQPVETRSPPSSEDVKSVNYKIKKVYSQCRKIEHVNRRKPEN
jgi:hypothetical protein